MVDEDMETAAVAEHLEVTGVLVDVENDVQVLVSDELFQLDYGAHIRNGNRRFIQQLQRTESVTAQNDNWPRLRQFLEWLVPLAHLVEVDFTICEVDPNLEVVVWKWVRLKFACKFLAAQTTLKCLRQQGGCRTCVLNQTHEISLTCKEIVNNDYRIGKRPALVIRATVSHRIPTRPPGFSRQPSTQPENQDPRPVPPVRTERTNCTPVQDST